MDFKDLVAHRRSHRRFSDEEIAPEALQLILRSALMSPTSKSSRKWHFVVVDDKVALEKMADAKEAGAAFLKGAPLAIVVCAPPDEDECWIEDASIAAVTIQYQAADLGLGSCWAQMHGRGLSDGTTADEVIHGILGLDDAYRVLCVIAIGHYTDERKPQNEDALKWENVNLEKRILTVRNTVQRIKNIDGNTATKLVVTSPKSSSSVREIPLPEFIIPYLSNHRTGNSCYLLSGTQGIVEPRVMQYRFKRILAELHLSDVSFHSLRHLFATNCIAIGVDVKSLSEILGHSNVQITLNRYVHSSMERKAKYMKSVSELFSVA